MVKGLDTFAERFAGDEGQYVLIGGVAAYLLQEEAGLDPRATQDLDIVLCIEALTPSLGQKIWDFIGEGGYEVRQAGEAPRCFYRFAKPADDRFPKMLELFTREPDGLVLPDTATLTPVPMDGSVVSLSAILLDEDYYDLIHTHKRMLHGVPIISEHALIPLKAYAWLDLRARKDAGEQVDEKNIRKHRNDVFRLYRLLAPDQRVALRYGPGDDLARFIEAQRGKLSADYLNTMGIHGETEDAILDTLAHVFGVAP